MLAHRPGRGKYPRADGAFPFCLWLHAAVVSVAAATMLSAAYVLFRALYPVLLGPKLDNKVGKVSLPQSLPYLIVFYLLGSTVWAVAI